jgi:hypothetical protein
MQRRGDAEGLEVGRLTGANPIGVLDQLGHDQRGGEEGERRPVRTAEQLERRDDERGEAEGYHSGVRGRRAHLLCLSVRRPVFL